MRQIAIAAAILAPALAFAAGGDDKSPPKPTKTTTECNDGTVWDEKSKSCVAPKESRLDDDVLYRAAREFAYAGQYQHAIDALAAMSDPTEDRVLTYLGFAHRQSGETELGMAYYQQAIAKNPGNLLARSYMGQAYVKLGALELARAQLVEIQERGGRLTWAETSLRTAIESGKGHSY